MVVFYDLFDCTSRQLILKAFMVCATISVSCFTQIYKKYPVDGETVALFIIFFLQLELHIFSELNIVKI